MLVIQIRWNEGGPFDRQETFGGWQPADDLSLSHLEQLAGFIREWQQVTGIKPSEVTMVLVQDPRQWLDEYRAAHQAAHP